MELFVLQRYNEEALEKSSKPKIENENLEKLLKKVGKRKRAREQELTQKKIVESQPPEKLLEEVEDLVATKEHNANEVVTDIEEAHISDAAATEEGFKILGEDAANAKRPEVQMVLPPWLSHPTIISTRIDDDGAESLESLPYVTPQTRHALKEMQITRLFPVQTAVIPWVLEAHTKPPPYRPRDICVSAPTGSGKTLAFAIPVVQLLAKRVQRKIRALVVLPVAELALQVFKVFKKLCSKTDLTVCLLSKQLPFPLEQQMLVEDYKGTLYSKVDIVVTTPGRLVDHLHATKGFCLKSLKFLVIDEADRIMDAVFQNWLYHLDSHVRTTSDQLLSGRAAPLCFNELEKSAQTQPHKLLFSATLSQDPEKLQNLRLFQPKLFTSIVPNMDELLEKYATSEQQQSEARGEFIGKYTTPAELTEKYCITESRLKPLTLYSLIIANGWTKFLCFTNSAESSGRLAFVLTQLFKEDMVISDLSSALNAKQRANVLSHFSRGKVNGLVCSDALARGIDIPDVDIVISYDPPRHIKTYIHRIGRTARAGRPGTAIIMVTQNELAPFNQMLTAVGKSLTEEIFASTSTEEEHAKTYSVALQALREKLEKEKRYKLVKKARTKELALRHKDPQKMTFMEKLQVQASEAMDKKTAAQTEKKLSAKRNDKKKPFIAKKFNPSAGKGKKIKK